MKRSLLAIILSVVILSIGSAQKRDTVTTASGMKYYLTKKGSGPLLKEGEVAVWHYTLTLADGSVVDDSRKRNTALGSKIPTNRMIKGTSEALLLMHVGDRGIFILPPALGYGQTGADGGGFLPDIPPNATLYFDMELVDIKKTALLDTLEKTLFTGSISDTSIPRVAEVIALYKDIKKKTKFADVFTSDNDLNTIGYMMMPRYAQEAIAVFQLNVEEYPKVGNTYDSLGEAYMIAGDITKAISNYQKALEIDPTNTNAAGKIKQMREKRAKMMQEM